MSTVPRYNRAADLLEDCAALRRGLLPVLAAEMGVSPRQLERCRAEREPLPLPLQVRLAEAVLSLAPPLAPQARRLRDQALAASRLEDREQSIHPLNCAPSVARVNLR
jgi:hypothetical protein